MRWNRLDNVIEPLYDLFDLADPTTDMFPAGWNAVDDVTCSGGETESGIECVTRAFSQTGAPSSPPPDDRAFQIVPTPSVVGRVLRATLRATMRAIRLFRPVAEERDETVSCVGRRRARMRMIVLCTRYHHVSSVSVGATANILATSRELSTIWRRVVITSSSSRSLSPPPRARVLSARSCAFRGVLALVLPSSMHAPSRRQRKPS